MDPNRTTCPCCNRPWGQHLKSCRYYSRPQPTIPDDQLRPMAEDGGALEDAQAMLITQRAHARSCVQQTFNETAVRQLLDAVATADSFGHCVSTVYLAAKRVRESEGKL